MESDENKNITKIIISIIIFVVAFIIILLSAFLTLNIKNKEKKDLSTKNLGQSKIENKITKNEIENVESKSINKLGKYLNNVYEEDTNNIYSNIETTSKVKKNHRLPVQNPNAIQLCKDAQNSTEKNIYLTFDDGPSPKITPQIF